MDIKNDIKKQIKELKLFWQIFKKRDFLFQVTYLMASFIAVIVYIVSPDLIPGPIDDLLVAPWLVPLVLSKVWTALLPDWFVEEQKKELEEKLTTKPNA